MRTRRPIGSNPLLAALALALAAPAAAATPGEAGRAGNAPEEAAPSGAASAPAAPTPDAVAPPGAASSGVAPAAPAAAADALAALPEAAPKGFAARVEPDQVQLGRPFALTLEVRHDPAERYSLAGPPELGGLALRGPPAVERTEADGIATTRVVLQLAAFDALGDRELPAQTLIAEGPAGKAKLSIPGPPLHVIATSEGDRLENPPPQPLVLVAWDRIAIAAGAVLALALAGFALWRWRKRRPAGAAAAVELDRRTPEERALAALDALEADPGPARERYFRLSEVVRGFLADASGLAAVDRTTAELCDELSRRAVPGLSVPLFRAWLERGDLVRFAREEPGPVAAAADLEEARATVREVAAALRAEEERRRAEAAARPPAPAAPGSAPGSAPGGPGPGAAASASAEGPNVGAPPAPKAGEGGR